MFELLTWQDWAVVYFSIGVAVFLSVFVSHHLTTRKAEVDQGTEFAAMFNPKPVGLRGVFLDSVLGPLLAAMLVCAIWPYAIWLKIEEKWFPAAPFPDPPAEGKPFSVSRGDLLEHLSFDEIEAAAFVTDPLGAVPDLPFGHLHGAWKRLKETSVSGDEIWTFSAPLVRWGCKYVCTGYAIVHVGEIGAFWVTDTQALAADAAATQDNKIDSRVRTIIR